MIGIDPEYFLDRMSQDEIIAIYKARHEIQKITWEQTRTICFYNVVSQNGTKVFKRPSDLFKFPWEQRTKEKGVTSKEAQKLLENGKKGS